MDIFITDIALTPITGVRVSLPQDYRKNLYCEDYFTWSGMPIVSEFKTKNIMMGILEGWHHTPNFDKIEYHEDKESFYFISGTALMYFVDIRDGKPVMETSKIVRIPAGTELEIEAGKGHFVAVAEDDRFSALVTSPSQAAPRIVLPETVCGK
jgi:hypothetical protein